MQQQEVPTPTSAQLQPGLGPDKTQNEIREKALEIYSWLQDSKLRAEDGT